MAQIFRVTIDVAYRDDSPPVTASAIRVQLLMDLDSASFPGVIHGFAVGVDPLEDGGALLRKLTPPNA